ncbi:MAG: hypothetical protein IPL31_15775 [Saprospiraceae bacterium]|nr:hypothetical protein [Saprospiraceae bacterium]
MPVATSFALTTIIYIVFVYFSGDSNASSNSNLIDSFVIRTEYDTSTHHVTVHRSSDFVQGFIFMMMFIVGIIIAFLYGLVWLGSIVEKSMNPTYKKIDRIMSANKNIVSNDFKYYSPYKIDKISKIKIIRCP